MKLNRFFKDAGVVFVTTVIASVLAMFYQLFMVRALSPVDFGVLNTLLSLMIVVTMPSGMVQTVATKFVASFKALNETAKIREFLWLFFGKLFVAGLVILFLSLVFCREIAAFFKIEDPLVIVIAGLVLMLSLILPLPLGGIQGLQKFKSLGTVSVINVGLKLAAGIIFVRMGWRVAGALGAAAFGALAALFTSFIPLFNFLKKDRLMQ